MSSRNTINETNKNSDNHFLYKPQKLHQQAECRPSLGGGGGVMNASSHCKIMN